MMQIYTIRMEYTEAQNVQFKINCQHLFFIIDCFINEGALFIQIEITVSTIQLNCFHLFHFLHTFLNFG